MTDNTSSSGSPSISVTPPGSLENSPSENSDLEIYLPKKIDKTIDINKSMLAANKDLIIPEVRSFKAKYAKIHKEGFTKDQVKEMSKDLNSIEAMLKRLNLYMTESQKNMIRLYKEYCMPKLKKYIMVNAIIAKLFKLNEGEIYLEQTVDAAIRTELDSTEHYIEIESKVVIQKKQFIIVDSKNKTPNYNCYNAALKKEDLKALDGKQFLALNVSDPFAHNFTFIGMIENIDRNIEQNEEIHQFLKIAEMSVEKFRELKIKSEESRIKKSVKGGSMKK